MNALFKCGPIWIGKLDASGQKLLFATYLGNGLTNGSYTAVAGIAADSNGNLIVAAHSTVPDLPTVRAFQSSPKSQNTNLYVAKISPDGSRILYATYLGGSGGQSAISLAVDGAGAAYVAASTGSADFPTTPHSAHEPSPFPTVVAKLSPEGTLVYAATFLFEFYTDVKPIQVDTAGSALLASNVRILKVAPDGSSLTRTALPSSTPAPWVLPRSTGGFQYVGTAASGIPVTADAVQTFADSSGYVRLEDGRGVHSLGATVSGLAVDPKERNRIYAATPTGLFRSENNGWTWTLLHDGSCLAIAVDPFDSNRIYVSLGAAQQIDRSTDGGATWTAIYGGGPGGNAITSIAADPNIPGLLYAAGRLVFRSKNGGDTWDSRSVGPSRPDISPSASSSTSSVSVQADPAHPGWAYVLGITRCIGFCPVTQNLSRTQDGGNTWANATVDPDPPVSSTASPVIAVNPFSGDVITVPNETQPTVAGADTTAAAFDPEHPGTIYLAVHIARGSGSGYFVIKSVDNGSSWVNMLRLDRPLYGLTVGAGGVLHGSQTPNLPQGYLVVTDAVGSLSYGTYLGGPFTQVNAVATSGGKVFVAGKTQGGLPLANAAQPAFGGDADAFIAAFDENGVLLWSTYLGGSAADTIDWVLPLPDGSVVVVGTTASTDFPSLQPSPFQKGDTFIARLRP